MGGALAQLHLFQHTFSPAHRKPVAAIYTVGQPKVSNSVCAKLLAVEAPGTNYIVRSFLKTLEKFGRH